VLVRTFPVPDPGVPDSRTPGRYLWWLVRQQRTTVIVGMIMGITWMVAQALMPAAIGRAIDAGIVARNGGELLRWTLILLGLGILQSIAGVLRHRCAVTNWRGAGYRTMQVTVRHSVHLGASLPRRIATGEVVSIGTSDLTQVGGAIDITARGSGAVVSVVVVSIILISTSLPLGLVVVLGVPALLAIVGLLIRPLHHRQEAYRDQVGELNSRATDIVTGLRILRGIGGEAAFSKRYAEESQRVRATGVRVARVESWLEAAQILLPGIFVVLVTWLGARFALSGEIGVGQLVAFYGYAVFLLTPLRTLAEAADQITRGHVAARRLVRLLGMQPEGVGVTRPELTENAWKSVIRDPESGVVIAPGQLTAIAAARPEDAVAIADRLGGYTPGQVRLGDVRLADLDRDTMRATVLVADNDARLFSGRLRDELLSARGGIGPDVGSDGAAGTEELLSALEAASATDIVAALAEGLDEDVAEQGREFSGGQQQRLRLARALLTDSPVLVLVEPTSAVDAHTEARIAAALGAARGGRTTVVCTTSPLVLGKADEVLYVESGRVRASGTHEELLRREPRYVNTVTRGEDS
jgi:ABC-type multidrug transport system fused ATPase/permease subunit